MSPDIYERGKRVLESTAASVFSAELSATFLAKLAETYGEDDLLKLYQIVANVFYQAPEVASEYVIKLLYFPYLRAIKKELGIDNDLFAKFLNKIGGTDDIAVNPNR